MKTRLIILSAIALLSLYSCKQETDPNAALENEETRAEMFDAIANNQTYMTEFMDNIQANKPAMQMMQGNHKMMGNMMQGDGMQMMMMKDSMMRKSMMQSMMMDGKMMGNMMQMMHEKGMMSEDCMKSSKQMMGEKGMGMMDGKVEMQSKKELNN